MTVRSIEAAIPVGVGNNSCPERYVVNVGGARPGNSIAGARGCWLLSVPFRAVPPVVSMSIAFSARCTWPGKNSQRYCCCSHDFVTIVPGGLGTTDVIALHRCNLLNSA